MKGNPRVPVGLLDRRISLRAALVLILLGALVVVALGITIREGILGDRYQRVSKVEHDFRAARLRVRANPGSPGLRNELGWTYLQLGMYDRGQTEFEAALALEPRNLTTRFNIAFALIQKGALAAARDILVEIRGLDPGMLAARYALAEVFRGLKQYDEALRELEFVNTFHPGRTDVHYLAGQIYEAMGKQSQAGVAYREGLRFDPDNRLLQRALENLGG